jgi:YD repeat-containing protein
LPPLPARHLKPIRVHWRSFTVRACSSPRRLRLCDQSLALKKSDATTILSFAFTRDANGNITRSDREDGSYWTYGYDGLQRLTSAVWKDSSHAVLHSYAYEYDKIGNRTRLVADGVETVYTYNAANELIKEEVTGGDTTYYTYDGRGNQVQKMVVGGHTWNYTYNSRDLITKIDSTESGFTPNEFEYNALGQRTRITDSTGTTYFVWDGIRITHEHDGAGNVTKRYTYGHSPIVGVSDLLDLQDLEAGGDPHYFYHFDQVGGVHKLTAEDEATAQTLEFSPCGHFLPAVRTSPGRGWPAAGRMVASDHIWRVMWSSMMCR